MTKVIQTHQYKGCMLRNRVRICMAVTIRIHHIDLNKVRSPKVTDNYGPTEHVESALRASAFMLLPNFLDRVADKRTER